MEKRSKKLLIVLSTLGVSLILFFSLSAYSHALVQTSANYQAHEPIISSLGGSLGASSGLVASSPGYSSISYSQSAGGSALILPVFSFFRSSSSSSSSSTTYTSSSSGGGGAAPALPGAAYVTVPSQVGNSGLLQIFDTSSSGPIYASLASGDPVEISEESNESVPTQAAGQIENQDTETDTIAQQETQTMRADRTIELPKFFADPSGASPWAVGVLIALIGLGVAIWIAKKYLFPSEAEKAWNWPNDNKENDDNKNS